LALLLAGLVFVIWFLICAWRQLGFYDAVGVVLRPLVFVGVLYWISAWYDETETAWVPFGIPVLCIYFWTHLTGTRSALRDWLCVLLTYVILVGLILIFTRRKKASPSNAEEAQSSAGAVVKFVVFGLTALILAWILISATDYLVEKSRPMPIRGRDSRVPALPSEWPGLKIAVALSGGGYRAALMHAGVLSALDSMHVPVTNLAGVSGGSIIAAYYAIGGRPEDFLAAVQEHRFLLTRDLTSFQNAIRLPFPLTVPLTDVRLFPWYRFSRSDVQANLLDRVLYRGTNISSIDRPLLILGATDLLSGSSIGITNTGLLTRPLIRPEDKQNLVNASHGALNKSAVTFATLDPATLSASGRLAMLVVASGAFPVAFAPVEVHIEESLLRPSQDLFLVDGGISDNTGLWMLLDMDAQARDDLQRRLESVPTTNKASKSTPPSSKDSESIIAAWEKRPSEADLYSAAIRPWNIDLIISSDASAGFSNRSRYFPTFAPEVPTASRVGVQLTQTLNIIYSNIGPRPQPDSNHPPIWLVSPNFPTAFIPTDQEHDFTLPGTGKLASLLNNMTLDPVPPFALKSATRNDLTAEALESWEAGVKVAHQDYLQLAQILLSDTGALIELMNSMGDKWSQKRKQGDFMRMLTSPQENDRISAEYEWAEDLRKEVNEDRIQFSTSSTLDDDPSPAAAKRLFMFGRLLVLTEWLDLKRSLTDINNAKRSAAIRPAAKSEMPDCGRTSKTDLLINNRNQIQLMGRR
jgi:predicted acylesterase/phospholipase RssA